MGHYTSPTVLRSGALPVKVLELVVGKRQICGDLSPESALPILQKTPPDAFRTHDQTHATASIYSPVDRTGFLGCHYLKLAQSPVGHLWVRRKIQRTR